MTPRTETAARTPRREIGETAPQPDRPSLEEIARQECVKAEGIVETAALGVKRRLLADQDLLDSMLSKVCHSAASRACFEIDRRRRLKVWGSAANGGPRSDLGLVKMAQTQAETLLDFPINGGQALGDATREDVLKAAGRYASVSKDARLKALFLDAVAGRVPDGRVVRDVLDADALQAMHDGVHA